MLPALTLLQSPRATAGFEDGCSISSSRSAAVRSSQSAIRSPNGTYSLTPLKPKYQRLQDNLSARARSKLPSPSVTLQDLGPPLVDSINDLLGHPANSSSPARDAGNSPGRTFTVSSLASTEANTPSLRSPTVSLSSKDSYQGAMVSSPASSSLWMRRRSTLKTRQDDSVTEATANSNPFTHPLGINTDPEICSSGRSSWNQPRLSPLPPQSTRERGRTGNLANSGERKLYKRATNVKRLSTEQNLCQRRQAENLTDARAWTVPDLGDDPTQSSEHESSGATTRDRIVAMMERSRTKELTLESSRVKKLVNTKAENATTNTGEHLSPREATRDSYGCQSQISPRGSGISVTSSSSITKPEVPRTNERKMSKQVSSIPIARRIKKLETQRKAILGGREDLSVQNQTADDSSEKVLWDSEGPNDIVPTAPLEEPTSPVSPSSDDSPKHREFLLKTAVLAKFRRKNQRSEDRWKSVRNALHQGRLTNAGLDIALDSAMVPNSETELVWELMQRRYFVLQEDAEMLPDRSGNAFVEGGFPSEHIPKGSFGMMKAFMMQELTQAERRRLQRVMLKNAPNAPVAPRGSFQVNSSVLAALERSSNLVQEDDGASCISGATCLTKASKKTADQFCLSDLYCVNVASKHPPSNMIDVPIIGEHMDKMDNGLDNINVPVLKLHIFGQNLDLFGAGRSMDRADEEPQCRSEGSKGSNCSKTYSDAESEDDEHCKGIASVKVIQSGIYYYPLYPGHPPLRETFACM